LHSDIAKIKAWVFEEGDGNYLVQKEGLYYRVWSTSRQSGAEKNSLLVRLLPFVDSLKKLPDNVQLVYQSKWGSYLSVYNITQ
jgi:hydroxylamine oxidation protein HaoB